MTNKSGRDTPYAILDVGGGGGSGATQTVTDISGETELESGLTVDEYLDLTPEQQTEVAQNYVDTASAIDSEFSIAGYRRFLIDVMKTLSKYTPETYKDDILGVKASDFNFNKINKALDFSPYSTWDGMVDDWMFNIYNVKQKASISTQTPTTFQYTMWENFYTWFKKSFGTWARVEEGFDGFIEGVSEKVGDLAGKVVSGAGKGFLSGGGGKIILIAGVGIVLLVMFASSDRGTRTAQNVGQATAPKVSTGGK